MKRRRPLNVLSLRSPAMVMAGVFLGIALETLFAEDWGLKGWFAFITGVVAVAYTAWCWLGRSVAARSWAVLTFGANLALVGVPAFGFAMLAVGVRVVFNAPYEAGIALGMVAGAHFMILILGGGDCPRWWGPRWYRKGEFGPEDEAPFDPLGATLKAHAIVPEKLSRDEARELFGSQDGPVAEWRGGWVYDPAATKRDHPLAWKGRVEGRLAWYEKGLAFAATRQEDAMRGKPTVLTVGADEISEVSVVPPRADADGVKKGKGFLYRSLFPRVVVHAKGHKLLFDVARGKARQVAEFLNDQLEARS